MVEEESAVCTEAPTEIKCEDIENEGEIKASKNPLYSKYFKMLQVGVPAQAVKLKMKSEGLDPDILDQI